MDPIYKNALIDFYEKNKKLLANPSEIIEITNGIFNRSHFSGSNKEPIRKMISNDEIIFGLKDKYPGWPAGILFNNDCFYICDCTFTSEKKIQKFTYEDFLTIEFTSTFFGKITRN